MLTRQQTEQLLEEVLIARSETDEAECKSGTGEALQHALCAMSNRRDRNGGVVFIGVDGNFQMVGIADIETTQRVIADWTAELFNVSLRVVPEIINHAGHSILAVIVPPCPPGHRPCHFERLSREEVLRSVHAIVEHEGKWYPTPTGLLFFCNEPQRYLPQSALEFLHLWGPELTSLGPDNSRWRLNRELSGTLPQIITEAEALLLERIATRGIINGFRRHDEPEYPRFAMREAIVNAVAHRDYTMRGSRIQVRLFPDRIEVHTPGGLPSPVTVDNIEDEQATRNEAIVSLLQDFGFMEKRGYGFNGIVATMREAGLSPRKSALLH